MGGNLGLGEGLGHFFFNFFLNKEKLFKLLACQVHTVSL